MDSLVNALLTRTIVPALLLMVVLASCATEPERVPAACSSTADSLLAALQRAPGPVVLAGGTRLSRCMSLVRTDAELQSLGLSFSQVADMLRTRARADPAAALQLGYLAGAVRAGASAAASGVADQLARRIRQLATLEPNARPTATAALQRGMRFGQSSG